MVDTPSRILLSKEELEMAANELYEKLTPIPLYDVDARRTCIANYIEYIQRAIGHRILDHEAIPDTVADVRTQVFTDML